MMILQITCLFFCGLCTALAHTEEVAGILGPSNVTFDVNGSVGTLLVEADRLGVSLNNQSQSLSEGFVCLG